MRWHGEAAYHSLSMIVAWLLMAGVARGAAPILTGIDPPGVTVGEAADWVLRGSGLARVELFEVSGAGITVVRDGPAEDDAIRVKVRASPDATPGIHELRLRGPAGVSNLLLFRVDRLPQAREAEPNGGPSSANPVCVPSAVAGALSPRDVDWFAFQGRAGTELTVEVEARRLGAPIVPVARLLGPSGAALALSQPLRAVDSAGVGDCRLSCVLPEDGRYAVEVRDLLYRGGDAARYWLRIDTHPHADGLFPLGGRRGETICVAASGGTLKAPCRKLLTLPDEAGIIVEPGPFDGPTGPLEVPGKLVVGDGPEINEPPGGAGGPTPPAPVRLPFGATANDRLDRPGEVDRYVVAVTRGEPVLVEVQAAALGSWLDSVVTVTDPQGRIVAENDDRPIPWGAGPDGSFVPAARDSRLEIGSAPVEELTLAIADRFDDGGPPYAYRLYVGPPHADFQVTLRLAGRAPELPTGLGASGALNLRPGSSISLRLLISTQGRPGPITLRARGLPPGVTAEPVTLRVPRPGRGNSPPQPIPLEATLVLKVDPDAQPASGVLRIVAGARTGEDSTLERRASALVTLAPPLPDDFRPPTTRVIDAFPVSIVTPDDR